MAQNMLGSRGFKLIQMNGHTLFHGKIVTNSKNTLTKYINLFLQNLRANLNQTWHKACLSDGDSRFTNEGPHLFPRGNNNEIVKVQWRNLIIFSRIIGLISAKLGTKHPWVKGIQNLINRDLWLSKMRKYYFSLNQFNHSFSRMCLLIETIS